MPRECILIPGKMEMQSFSASKSGENNNQLNTVLNRAGVKPEFLQYSEQDPIQCFQQITDIIDPKHKGFLLIINLPTKR